jgi:hypothetical protein
VVTKWHVVALRGKPLSRHAFEHWFTKFPEVLDFKVEGDPNSYARAVHGNLKKLPSRLKSLRFEKSPYDKSLILADLPETIETLSICDYWVDVRNIKLPHLKSLDICSQSLDPNESFVLPDSIVRLFIHTARGAVINYSLPIQYLPPNLQHLTIGTDLPPSMLSQQFPSTLQTLIFRYTSNDVCLKCVQNLPPQLKTLYLFGPPNVNKITPDIVARFPPSLTTSLKIFNTIDFTENVIKSLPLGLQYLCIGGFCIPHDWSNSIHRLPPSLTHLEVNSHDILNPQHRFPLKLACIQALPRLLESLIVSSIDVIEDANLVFAALPRSLTLLTFSIRGMSGEINADCMMKLPPKLQSLHLNCKLDENCFRGLPKTLTLLNANVISLSSKGVLSLPANLTSVGLGSTEVVDSSLVEMSAFPRTLTSLSLEIPTIANGSLQGLPPNLSELTLECSASPGNPSFSEQCLSYLPRSLTFLRLGPAWNTFTDAGIHQLPLGLRKFIIDNYNDITPAVFPHLPSAGYYSPLIANEIAIYHQKQFERDD